MRQLGRSALVRSLITCTLVMGPALVLGDPAPTPTPPPQAPTTTASPLATLAPVPTDKTFPGHFMNAPGIPLVIDACSFRLKYAKVSPHMPPPSPGSQELGQLFVDISIRNPAENMLNYIDVGFRALDDSGKVLATWDLTLSGEGLPDKFHFNKDVGKPIYAEPAVVVCEVLRVDFNDGNFWQKQSPPSA